MRTKKGLIVSRQISSARAFSQWLSEKSTAELYIDFEVLCYASSKLPFLEKNIPFVEIQQYTEMQKSFDIILLGTSLNKEDDALWIKWAQKNKIPHICYIDQWVNYADRFSDHTFPDHIWVLDSVADETLRKEIPRLPSKIHIVGTPALNELHQIQRRPQNIVTFVTEPSSYLGGDNEFKMRHGLFDLEAFSYFLNQFSKSKYFKSYQIQIALHPIDKLERVLSYLRTHHFEYLNQISIEPSDKTKILSESKLIVGFRTFLLYESSLLKIPTLSIQIGRINSSDLTDRHDGITVFKKESDLLTLDLFIENLVHTEQQVFKNHHLWTTSIQQILKI